MTQAKPMTVRRCMDCGHAVFPARLWCPSCGGERAEALTVAGGTVLSQARQRDGSVILTVTTDPGVALVARLEGEAVVTGQRVTLEDRGEGVPLPWARPRA